MPIVSTPGQINPPPQKPVVPPVQPVVSMNDDTVINSDNPDLSANVPTQTQTPPAPTRSSRVQSMMPKLQTQPATSTTFSEDAEDDFSLDDFDSDDDFSTPMPGMTQPSGNGAKMQSLSRMTEDDRRHVISEAFELVLGKEPTDRDFSYYRFSTLNEDSLVKSLLSLPEHKQMIEKAKEHTSLKQAMQDLDIRVKQMDSSIVSMQQELYTLQQLLIEKNRYIQQMRGVPADRQAQPLPPQQFAAPAIQNAQMNTAPQAPVSPPPTEAPQPVNDGVEVKKLPGPMDEMKSMLGSIFGKKS